MWNARFDHSQHSFSVRLGLACGVVALATASAATAAKLTLKTQSETSTYTENGVPAEPPSPSELAEAAELAGLTELPGPPEVAILPPFNLAASATAVLVVLPEEDADVAATASASSTFLIEGDAGEEIGSCVVIDFEYGGEWFTFGSGDHFDVDAAIGGGVASASASATSESESADASSRNPRRCSPRNARPTISNATTSPGRLRTRRS